MASVKIKLKVPATQHHHRNHPAPAHWHAISNVRFLFGLPTYVSSHRRFNHKDCACRSYRSVYQFIKSITQRY